MASWSSPAKMAMQDELAYTDCAYLAIAAIQKDYTAWEVEITLRQIRIAAKHSYEKSRQRGALLCAG